MNIFKNITLLLIANIFGFVAITGLFHLLQIAGFFTQETSPETISEFFNQALIFFAGGVFISLGFLLIASKTRYVFLCAPILCVLLYGFKLIL